MAVAALTLLYRHRVASSAHPRVHVLVAAKAAPSPRPRPPARRRRPLYAQVSNQPATAAAAEGVPGQGMAVAPGTVGMMLPTRRKADGSALNGAGARAAAPAAAAAAWLLAAALALAA